MAAQLKEALRIIRRRQVEEMTGLPKSSLYLAIKNGTFPAPIKLGARSVGWNISLVRSWIAARIAEAGQGQSLAGFEISSDMNQDEGN